MIKLRDKKLESTFYKSFKPHQHSFASSLQLPEEYEDILFSLFDGYKSSLFAFSKFYTRQKQSQNFLMMGYQKEAKEAQIKLKEWKDEHRFYK